MATKPPTGTALNTSHALYSGLVGAFLCGEGSGNAADSLGGNSIVKGSAATWNANGIETVASSNGHCSLSAGSGISSATAITIFARIALTNTTQTSVYLMNLLAGTTDQALLFGFTARLLELFRSGGNPRLSISTYTAGDTGLHTVAVTWNNNTARVYFDGTYITQKTSASAFSGPGNIYIGSSNGSANRSALTLNTLLVWNKVLADADITSLHADPWQMYLRSKLPAPLISGLMNV